MNVWYTLTVIISTLVGAGFISGREILDFFVRFGSYGLIGIQISSVIFGVVITFVLQFAKYLNVSDYSTFINKNPFLLYAVQVVSFASFCIMIAAVGAFFQEELHIHYWIGIFIATSICYFVLAKRFQMIKIFDFLIFPFIAVGISLLCSLDCQKNVVLMPFFLQSDIHKSSWFISTILYTNYNLLILIPLLVNTREKTLSNRQIAKIGTISTLVINYFMTSIYHLMIEYYPNIMSIELPNMVLASSISSAFELFYALVMLVSIFSTAFSCGYSFLKSKNEKSYENNLIFMCLTAFLVGKFGFSQLLNTCFPIFGIVGGIQLLIILQQFMNQKKRKVSYDKK